MPGHHSRISIRGVTAKQEKLSASQSEFLGCLRLPKSEYIGPSLTQTLRKVGEISVRGDYRKCAIARASYLGSARYGAWHPATGLVLRRHMVGFRYGADTSYPGSKLQDFSCNNTKRCIQNPR